MSGIDLPFHVLASRYSYNSQQPRIDFLVNDDVDGQPTPRIPVEVVVASFLSAAVIAVLVRLPVGVS